MINGIKQAQNRLLSAITEGHVPHACFISCPDIAMAETVARRAAALYCTGAPDPLRLASCADCIIPGELKVDNIREIIAELAKRSFSGGKRAVLLLNAHNMTEPAQNALLKTLEEPPDDVLFLLTGNDAGLLPTIISRSATVLCGLPTADEVADELAIDGVSPHDARFFARAGVTLDCARKLAQDAEYRALRENAQAALAELLNGRLPFEKQQAIASPAGARFMLSFMRDMLLFRERGMVFENPDREHDIAALARRFTSGRISCIIESLATAVERMNTNASPQATFTRLFTEIAEEIQ